MPIQTYTWYICSWPPTKTSKPKEQSTWTYNHPNHNRESSFLLIFMICLFLFLVIFSFNFNVICSVSFHSYLKDSCVFLRQKDINLEIENLQEVHSSSAAWCRNWQRQKDRRGYCTQLREKDGEGFIMWGKYMVVFIGDRRDKGDSNMVLKVFVRWCLHVRCNGLDLKTRVSFNVQMLIRQIFLVHKKNKLRGHQPSLLVGSI